MSSSHSTSENGELTFTISLDDARLLGLRPIPSVGKNKRGPFKELLSNAGIVVGGGLYRPRQPNFFFTNITFSDWLKEKGIVFHSEHVISNLLLWLRQGSYSLTNNLYLAVGRMTNKGKVHKIVKFDPYAPEHVRQSYKGVWALAGSFKILDFLERHLKGLVPCSASDILGCTHLITKVCSHPLCSSCMTNLILRICQGKEGDLDVSTKDLYSMLGMNDGDSIPFINVVDNKFYIKEKIPVLSFMSVPQRRQFRSVMELLSVTVSQRDPLPQEKQHPIPGIPFLMELLEEKGLMPSGGLEEVGKGVIENYSINPSNILDKFGWNEDRHGKVPEQVYSINMVICPCGKSSSFTGGCAAIYCTCQREFCRICSGSALNAPATPDHPHCGCGQFLGRDHCYVEESQRREVDFRTIPGDMNMVSHFTNTSCLQSLVHFLRNACPGVHIPSPNPLPPLLIEAQRGEESEWVG